MVIDKIDVISALRNVYFNAEIVDVIATGERIGIRDGAYDPGLYTRPDDPAKRPIGTLTNTELIDEEFDRNALSYFISESFLPATEIPTGNYVNTLFAIMQYSVFVPSKDGNRFDIKTMYNYAKYIQNAFDPELDNLTIQYNNGEIVIDSVDIAPPVHDGGWNLIPISVNFRAYAFK